MSKWISAVQTCQPVELPWSSRSEWTHGVSWKNQPFGVLSVHSGQGSAGRMGALWGWEGKREGTAWQPQETSASPLCPGSDPSRLLLHQAVVTWPLLGLSLWWLSQLLLLQPSVQQRVDNAGSVQWQKRNAEICKKCLTNSTRCANISKFAANK